MGHYARVLDGIVEEVIVCDDIEFAEALDRPGIWVQTSYNTFGNQHVDANRVPDGGVAVRGNYAGPGYSYDSDRDVFIPPSPYPSWVLNTNTYQWEPPIPKPDGGLWRWDESKTEWRPIKKPRIPPNHGTA
jgi:hypothetical protein